MKKGKHFRKTERRFSFRRGVLLGIVSLLLAGMTAVTSTISWIEDVSQVEFSSTEGQETPLHIGNTILKSDAKMTRNAVSMVDLSKYFNKSGDMHLSPCYGDGDNFYFPVENGATGYRVGTKDDANVNYLSATFRLISVGANTAYWFEPTGNTPYVTFKNGGASGATVDLNQYLRCSITIDGVTTVYALNNTGTFKTVVNNTVTDKDGKQIGLHTYYTEQFNNNLPADNSSLANQGGGSNLNGNTLFNVNQYVSNNKNTVKTVTVKLWLEYSEATAMNNADLASVNLNLVSSWAKERRIFVHDKTVHQSGYSQAAWLGTYDATLWFALRDNLDTHKQLTSLGNGWYYMDIPAVYNNADVVFFRCAPDGWGWGDQEKTYTSNGTTVHYWNMWQTTFPNTYHSETYTVYSTDFATWEEDSNVHAIYYVNSAFFNEVYDYMWDSASVHDASDINGKVVKNANWPGVKMTAKMNTKTNSESLDAYAFFYNSDYDRIIFNDNDLVQGANQEYQTQDLWLTNNEIDNTFDMTTLTWFHTNPNKSDWSTKMPNYSGSNTYLFGNFSTNNVWKKTRFAYDGEYDGTSGNEFNNTSTSNMLCKVYIKNNGDFEFIAYYNGNCYKTHKDAVNLNVGESITLRRENTTHDNKYYDKNVYAKSLTKGSVYRFYMSNPNNDTVTITLAAG